MYPRAVGRLQPLPPRPWNPDGETAPRLLIVRLSALGDVIHALPVLPALHRAWPHVRLDWVVEDRAADLLEGRREIDRVVVFPRRELRRLKHRPLARTQRALAFLKELRARRYGAALDLQGNLKSGVIARASGARHRYGLDRRVAREANELFSTRRHHPSERARHRVERNLELVSAIVGRALAWEDPGLPPAPNAAKEARRRLLEVGAPPSGYIVLHPGTSAFGTFKRWPTPRYADLARTLCKRGEAVIVTAPPGEEALAHGVAEASGGAARVVETPGLDVLGEVLRGARLFVGADTGPLHLASLAGTPVVGLFGPKDAEVYGPWGRSGADTRPGRLRVVCRNDVACRPCTLRRCAAPVCMTGLEPENVLEAVDATLATATPGP